MDVLGIGSFLLYKGENEGLAENRVACIANSLPRFIPGNKYYSFAGRCLLKIGVEGGKG
jgi:hypothetical protein